MRSPILAWHGAPTSRDVVLDRLIHSSALPLSDLLALAASLGGVSYFAEMPLRALHFVTLPTGYYSALASL